MGQKVNPNGMRIGINKTWNSFWIADKKEMAKFIKEDDTIRKYILKNYKSAGISSVKIERGGDSVTISIETTYIEYSGGVLTFTVPAPSIGNMKLDENHTTPNADGGFYFKMNTNDVPYNSDWSVRYKPTTADAIQRIREGVTSNAGNTGGETLVKYSDTEWYVEGWAIGGAWQDGDILIVDGIFENTTNGARFQIDKTYILYSDGALKISAAWPLTVELGNMQAHPEHLTPNSGSIYFTLAQSEYVPFASDWSVEYFPMNDGTIKRIRDGVTTDVTNKGAGTLKKYSETEWYMEGWATSGGLTTDGDIFVVEGTFNGASDGSGVTFNISKTYIYYKDGTLTFSTTMPESTGPISAGTMSLHTEKTAPQDGATYFTMVANGSIPSDSSTALRYIPTTADAIQRIRNGETTNVGNTGGETICKTNDTEWFIANWAIGGDPQDGDIYYIDGVFRNDSNGVIFVIESSYILYYDSVLTFSTTMPEIPAELSLGTMSEHASGYNGGGFYFTLAENADVPYGDWNVRYTPVSAGTIQLIRAGVTTDVTNTVAETIVKFGETDWYIEAWAIGGGLTENGDILVVEGEFTGNGVTFIIEKSYVLYYNGVLTFSTIMPEIPKEIGVGPMQEHKDGYNENGIFFSTEANEFIPSEVYYNPVTTGTMVLIRDGVEEEIGHSGRETLYKKNDTEWVLQGWTIGGIANMEDGDIIKIDGQFKNETNGVTFTMKTSYIVYRGGQVIVSDTLPQIVDVEDVTSEKTDATVTIKMNLNVAYNDVDSAAEVSAFLAEAKIGDVTLQSLVDAGYATITFTENTASKKHPTTMTIVFTATGYATIDNFAISFESMNYTNGTVNYSGNATTFARWIEIDGRAGFSSTDLVHLLKTTDGSADGSSMISKDINQDGYKDEMDEYWTRRILVGDSLETIANDLASGMPTTNPSNEMTIGVWNGSYHSFGTRDFNVLSEAEIDLIIGVDERYSNGMGSLLDKAEAANIDVLAYFSEWDSSTVPDWATKDALRGFLMWDEPTAKWPFLGSNVTLEGDLVNKQVAFNSSALKDKEFFVNLMAQCNSFEALYGSAKENFTGKYMDYKDDYVGQFTSQLDLKTLAFDSYGLIIPEGKNDIYLRPSFYQNFESIANEARDEGAVMQYTFCSAGHASTDGVFPMPSADELRWQMNLGLSFGATELAHYVYTSHEADYQDENNQTKAMVDYSTNKTTALYEDVKKVNHELKGWDELFLNFSWQGTEKYDVAPANFALNQMDGYTYTGSARIGFTTTQDMLVGDFINGAAEAFMVTNAGQAASEDPDNMCAFTMTSGEVTMTFAENYDRVAIVREGKTTVYFLDDSNAITFEVDAYEGVFVVPFTGK